MTKDYDFSCWATKNDILCTDGRIIRRDAFAHNDGKKVPLVWNHSHNDPTNVLGHAYLENRPEGVFAYGKFNDTPKGKHAKTMVQNGDIDAVSIFANQLQQRGPDVLHGDIKELSLVLAGANMEATIQDVISHGELVEDEGVIYTGEYISLAHASEMEPKDNGDEKDMDNKEETVGDVFNTLSEKQKEVAYMIIGMALEEGEGKTPEEIDDISHADGEGESVETVGDVWNTFNEKQKQVIYAIIAQALSEKEDNIKQNFEEEGEDVMKTNLFEGRNEMEETNVLSHADQTNIINFARDNRLSLRQTLKDYAEDNNMLAHGIEGIEGLFPDYEDVYPGAPEFIERDQGWVNYVMNSVHKSPISRIRTRQADITGADLVAHGYKKGQQKKLSGNIKLLKRTTDPQTIYRKDALHRDDIVDITDFDVVNYQYGVMKQNLYEDIATAILIGDGREESAEDKIEETHIRSIWNDDELYCIHTDVDIAAAKTSLQGTNTKANFGDNYVYAEAIITAALYAREKYKGSGNLVFFCTPHLLNVMLLARDLNGRRIYNSVNDVAAALNVSAIYTAEQFEGKVRDVDGTHKKKLLGIFVNLKDYHVGSTKGGEITKFNQFDIDYNQEKYLIETRLSGALTRVKSAIVLEEPVNQDSGS